MDDNSDEESLFTVMTTLMFCLSGYWKNIKNHEGLDGVYQLIALFFSDKRLKALFFRD